MDLINDVFNTGVSTIPLRPLLYTAGAAAVTIGVFSYLKRGDGKKATLDPEEPTEVFQDKETEDAEKPVASDPQLGESVRKLQDLLCEVCRDFDKKSKDCGREAHNIMLAQSDEMDRLKHKLKELLMEYGREREAHNQLRLEHKKVSLVEAEVDLQRATETTAHMQAENSELADQVGTLQDTVQDQRERLGQAHTEYHELKNACAQERAAYSIVQAENDELKKKLKLSEALLIEYERDREACNFLQVEYEEMKETLMHNEEQLKVSLAEAEEELQNAAETTAQIEAEKSELADQVGTMQNTMEDLRNLLCQAHTECDELKNEYERDREASNILQVDYEEMKKTLMHNEELLKVSLAETEAELQRATATTAQTKAEKSELSDQVGTLQDTVQDLRKLQYQTQIECDELKKVSAQEREAHSIVQAENDDLKEKLKQSEALIMEYERDREACNLLKVEYEEVKTTLTHNQELLNVSLLKVDENLQKSAETSPQTELSDQVETLQDTVEDLRKRLCQAHTECDELKHASAQERETHSIVQAETYELKEKLKLYEALIMEYERDQEACNLLQVEYGKLKKTLTHNEKLLKEYERDREACNLRQVEYKEMKATLIHTEESLKVSLAEVEEKLQKATETTARMEAEKSELVDQVRTLQDTVQDLRKLLFHANESAQERETHSIVQAEKLKLSEALLMEYERDREASNIPQVEYEELKKTLMHNEELLKVSLAETEAELQRATETTAQTKAEKCELSDQVGTLQDTVQDLRKLQYQTQIECDELKKESAQERKAHSIVQAENDELKDKLKFSEALLMEYERDREAWNLLQVEYEKMKATLTHNEEQLKVSLAKAEEKHRKTMETIAQLKTQKSDLGDEVCALQETVQNMGKLLCESQRDCDRLTDECTQQQHTHRIRRRENDDLKETIKHFLLEYERELEARNLLQFEHEEVKAAMTYSEELLKGSLAEAEAKYHKAMETIAQLEAQKSGLRDEVNRLQEALQNMRTLLREADCDELRDESHVSRAEPEKNHQNSDETLARLAAEKSDLADKIKRLQDTVQKLGNLLCEAHRDFDELANKYEQVQAAHNILQSKYNEMKESLKHKEELLKKHGVTFVSKKTTDVQTGGSVDMNGFSPEYVMNMKYKE